MLSQEQIIQKLLSHVKSNPGTNAVALVRATIGDEDCALDMPTLLESLIKKGQLTEIVPELSSHTLPALYFLKDHNITLQEFSILCDGEQVCTFEPSTKFYMRKM